MFSLGLNGLLSNHGLGNTVIAPYHVAVSIIRWCFGQGFQIYTTRRLQLDIDAFSSRTMMSFDFGALND